MAKIIMLKGLLGSGKTTWANQYVADNPTLLRIAAKYLETSRDF